MSKLSYESRDWKSAHFLLREKKKEENEDR